ncbi:MAG: hypothetical protein KF805_12705 [Phycisphaeraceae bacterium]|nr:hypothetical protein [Phycisphaeraceae bacterium]
MNTATQKTTHTTGPLEVVKGRHTPEILKGANTIARLHETSEGGMLANAYLFAAAPELLEACKEVVESLHNLGLQDCYGRSFGGTHTRGVDCPCTCCKVRAAIAKAEGR